LGIIDKIRNGWKEFKEQIPPWGVGPGVHQNYDYEKTQASVLEHVRNAGIGLKELKLGDDILEKSLSKRPKPLDIFKGIGLVEEKEWATALKTGPQADGLKADFNTIYALTTESEEAINANKVRCTKLVTMVQENPGTYFPLDEIIKIKADGLAAFDKQQEERVHRIDTLFDNQDFKDKLAAVNAGKHPTEDELQELKSNMQAAVLTAANAEKKAFEDKMRSIEDSMLKASANKTDLLFLLARLSKGSERMRKEIEKLSAISEAKKSGSAAAVEVDLTGTNTTLNFSGVSLADLKILETNFGLEIKQNNGVFSAEIPHSFNLLFTDDHALDTALVIAQALRASGLENVSMTTRHNDPAKAMKLARFSYEACLRVGYPPDKIAIYVIDEHGKKVKKTPDELYAGKPNERADAEKHGKEWSDQRKNSIEMVRTQNKAAKNQLKTGRTAQDADTNLPSQTNPPGTRT